MDSSILSPSIRVGWQLNWLVHAYIRRQQRRKGSSSSCWFSSTRVRTNCVRLQFHLSSVAGCYRHTYTKRIRRMYSKFIYWNNFFKLVWIVIQYCRTSWWFVSVQIQQTNQGSCVWILYFINYISSAVTNGLLTKGTCQEYVASLCKNVKNKQTHTSLIILCCQLGTFILESGTFFGP